MSWTTPHTRANAAPRVARVCAVAASLVAVQLAASGTALAAPCADAGLIPTSANGTRTATATLCLVNAERTRRHLGALRANAQLTRSATGHTRDMVAADYFDHVSPAGRTLLDWVQDGSYLRRGMAYELGENIALGTLQLATPAAIVDGWMASPGHRRNILNADFTDSGIGIVAQAPSQYAEGLAGATYTQQFGARA